jgi:type II secretory pathway component PulF
MKNIQLLLCVMAFYATPALAQDNAGVGAVMMIGVLIMLAGALLYFIPTAAAQYRKSSNTTTVFLVNLIFGWTVIGWIAALILAFSGDSGEQVRRHREMMEALNRNEKK